MAICSIWSAPWSQVVKVTDEIAITHAKAVQRWKSVFMRKRKTSVLAFFLAQLLFLLNIVHVSFTWVKFCVRPTDGRFVALPSLLIIRNSDFFIWAKAHQEQAAQTPGTQCPELSTLSLSSHPSVDFIALSAVRSELQSSKPQSPLFWHTIKRCHTRLLRHCFGLRSQLIKHYLKEVSLTKQSSQSGSLTDSEEGAS